MPSGIPLNPGKIDWTGENPGILLKDEAGAWSAMALFFRIAWSPKGPGSALLLYSDPQQAGGGNCFLTDNEELGRWLIDEFVTHFKAFAGVPAFRDLPIRPLRSAEPDGDPLSNRYVERVLGDDIAVELVWEDLAPPRALELPVSETATGRHEMFSVLVAAETASILVDGRPLPGKPGRRVQAGLESSTAFLYFCETWIRRE